jgi:hypothetical protein
MSEVFDSRTLARYFYTGKGTCKCVAEACVALTDSTPAAGKARRSRPPPQVHLLLPESLGDLNVLPSQTLFEPECH